MTQPTVTRHHTWRASTGLNEQVVNHAGEPVTVTARVTLQAYLHTFTLTRETWTGPAALRASGWWLRVEGGAAGPEGTYQRVAEPRAHWRDVARSPEVRQIVGFGKAAWAATRKPTVCDECHQAFSATGACWC